MLVSRCKRRADPAQGDRSRRAGGGTPAPRPDFGYRTPKGERYLCGNLGCLNLLLTISEGVISYDSRLWPRGLVKKHFMSLRKSFARTPASLAAHRRNGRKCAGPRTPAGSSRNRNWQSRKLGNPSSKIETEEPETGNSMETRSNPRSFMVTRCVYMKKKRNLRRGARFIMQK